MTRFLSKLPAIPCVCVTGKGDGHLESKSAHSQFFTNEVKNYKTVVLCIKYYNILHLLCKYLLRGQVTLGERAFGQILTLSDYPS